MVDSHHLVGPVGDVGEIIVDFDGDRRDDTERRSGTSNSLQVSASQRELS